jgi:hypothetical protein
LHYYYYYYYYTPLPGPGPFINGTAGTLHYLAADPTASLQRLSQPHMHGGVEGYADEVGPAVGISLLRTRSGVDGGSGGGSGCGGGSGGGSSSSGSSSSGGSGSGGSSGSSGSGSSSGGSSAGFHYPTQAWGAGVMVVEVKVSREQFGQLPQVLREGGCVKVIPTFFTQVLYTTLYTTPYTALYEVATM